ncbi:hypothetical protein WMF38_01555 [Sorangium sp. So ce118]
MRGNLDWSAETHRYSSRVLHVEFCFALRDDVPDRVFEYVGFLFAALRLEAPGEAVPPIESVAVVLMAAIDPWGHNLLKELIIMVEDKEEGLLRRTPIIGELIIEAEQSGEQRGEQRGEQKAIVALLGRLFARRLGRCPTSEEERLIVERARAIGPGEVEDALLDLEGEALIRWLAEPTPPS